jgi:hypothetical protein
MPKAGGTPVTIATGSTFPSGIATDGINVYWSEYATPGAVRKVPVDGGTPTILGSNVNNIGIAIDPTSTNVFWGESISSNSGKIDLAPINGGATTSLVSGLNNVWDVATDGTSVFWVENRTAGVVSQVALSGGPPSTLGSNLVEPVALAVDATNVYWIERNGGGQAAGTLKAVPKVPTVQVTVGTNLQGLTFQVDGITYSSQQSFLWLQGSSHSLTTTATQSQGSGSQSVWNSWTDGGQLSHSITATLNTTYTANFTAQFFLTTSATQGGTISPPSGWYNAGTVVAVSGTASGGFSFAGFSGNLTGTATPQSVVMSGPVSVSANFGVATYGISGAIALAGSALTGVTVSLTPGPSTATNSAGSYSFNGLAAGSTYTVTPSLAGYTFVPTSAQFVNLQADQTANFTATAVTYSISGQVTKSGTAFAGVTVTLSGGSSGAQITDAAGNYSFTNLSAGGNYAVTPSVAGYGFIPPSATFNNLQVSQPASFIATITRPGFDFNGDGKPDILWQQASSGELWVWFMNGASYAGATSISPPTAWRVPGAADFNGDGKPDILWQYPSTGELWVWYMNGTSWAGQIQISGATAWRVVGTGDFNGDGKPDILWQHPSTGELWVWYMNGASWAGHAQIGGPTAWSVVGTADLNADGKSDILWQHPSTGELWVWFMNGASWAGQAQVSPATAWTVVGTGDFNADGKPDILWQLPATGELWTWFMNGAAYSSAAQLGGATPWKAVGTR